MKLCSYACEFVFVCLRVRVFCMRVDVSFCL